jgi:small ligand-binding sensory domain FIST
MPVRIAVGLSDEFDAVEAFSDAARQARRGLGAPCDLCFVFAGAPHLGRGKWILSAVHDELEPDCLIGCGAGGVVGAGREIEEGPGAVVWAASLPEATLSTHELEVERVEDGAELHGLPDPDALGEALVVLADPYTFPTEALLAHLNEVRPGMPVLGGLASAAAAGSASLFRDGDVVDGGAVACSLAGVEVLTCVSQGAAPVGPEMTVTAAEGNVIEELASQPAIERLREAIASLDPREQELASGGLLLGIVIDENQPEYERGDFLVRPIVGADPSAGTIAAGERVRVGQTVRMHVRDGASADEDLRAALRSQVAALGASGAAGALLFTCNGRGSHMFQVPDHDAAAIDDALGIPAGGFFCAGEIGPVGGRNFLHGFTATMAVFPRAGRRPTN